MDFHDGFPYWPPIQLETFSKFCGVIEIIFEAKRVGARTGPYCDTQTCKSRSYNPVRPTQNLTGGDDGAVVAAGAVNP
jgi:hypothetical protein